jgi:hypothetical protein
MTNRSPLQRFSPDQRTLARGYSSKRSRPDYSIGNSKATGTRSLGRSKHSQVFLMDSKLVRDYPDTVVTMARQAVTAPYSPPLR